MQPRIILQPGREKSVRRRHPWLFSGAIRTVEGNPTSGQTVAVLDSQKNFLGWAAWSPQSQIRLRFWGFDEATSPSDPEFFPTTLRRAMALRQSAGWEILREGRRLVHGEADGMPGLIVDAYGPWLVCQFLSAGVEAHRQQIVQTLVDIYHPKGIFERSDTDARRLEGLEIRTGVLWGEAPPPLLDIWEGDLRFGVDVHNGHKTGHYLDQRINRARVQSLAAGKDVLNCFCYTGGFGLAAAAGGARSVLQVDSSAGALQQAAHNAERNGKSASITHQEADVFQLVRKLRGTDQRFDLIILDPPKFAENQASLPKACRGYKDVNLQAFHLLRPGGLLVTFSCSGLMGTDLFAKVVSDAALDAHRSGVIAEHLFQAPDHPIPLNFPEGLYLKGLVVQT